MVLPAVSGKGEGVVKKRWSGRGLGVDSPFFFRRRHGTTERGGPLVELAFRVVEGPGGLAMQGLTSGRQAVSLASHRPATAKPFAPRRVISRGRNLSACSAREGFP